MDDVATSKPPPSKRLKRNETAVVNPGRTVLQTDILFSWIASFCDSKTVLRLCCYLTEKHAVVEHRAKIAVSMALPRDERRLPERIGNESWTTVLRERVALDLPLKFTILHPLYEPAGVPTAMIVNPGNPNAARIEKQWRKEGRHSHWTIYFLKLGGICAGPFMMRQGVHRAVFKFSTPNDWEMTCCNFGVCGPERALEFHYSAKKSDFDDHFESDGPMDCPWPGSFNRHEGTFGMELDLNKKTLTVLELDKGSGQWIAPTTKTQSINGDYGVSDRPICGRYESSDDAAPIKVYEAFREGDNPPLCWAAETCMKDDTISIERRLEPFEVLESRTFVPVPCESVERFVLEESLAFVLRDS